MKVQFTVTVIEGRKKTPHQFQTHEAAIAAANAFLVSGAVVSYGCTFAHEVAK